MAVSPSFSEPAEPPDSDPKGNTTTSPADTPSTTARALSEATTVTGTTSPDDNLTECDPSGPVEMAATGTTGPEISGITTTSASKSVFSVNDT